jgi:CsoR family transcriptional regulator, copper-sensing transcriptional repressor
MGKTKKQTLIALKKAQTNINTIHRMIEEDKYCIDILQQILAVNGLLKSASNKILEEHLNTCFTDGMLTKDETTKKRLIKEVMDVIVLGNKAK